MNRHRERFYPLTVLIFSIGYISYGLFKTLYTLIGVPLVLLLTPLGARDWFNEHLTRRLLCFFTQTWLPLIGGYRMAEVVGVSPHSASHSVIYVANHRSLMDAVILLGCLPRTGTLIKARSARGMTFAILERCFDLVSVDQASHASIGASLDRCRGLLRSGKNLLIFPEGKRARSSRLQHFNRIAFDLAQASGARIVPAAIHSNCPFLSPLPGSIFPKERVVFRIRFLAPDEIRPEDTPQSVSDRIHHRIAEELKRLDAGTVWEQKPPVK